MNPLRALAKLLPRRVAKLPVRPNEDRLQLLGTVTDTDNCLRAVQDQQLELLAGEFQVAIDPRRSDMERLRACDGLRVAYHSLTRLEEELTEARRRRAEAEQQRTA